MGKIYKYLLLDFFKTLILYFMILFFLISVIYFVRIAGFTSVMSLGFGDIFQIYFYYVPQIIMYTFPLTYFIALVVSLYNFSKDGEVLVLFTLGFSPKNVVLVYLLISFLVSLLLVFNSLIMMPLSEQASKNYIKIKKVESKIDIKSSELGQSIGSWNIFVKDKEGNIYKDILLFSSDYNNNEQLILAKSAKFKTESGGISLTLVDGNSFSMGKDFVQTSFDTLKLSYKDSKDQLQNKGIVQYWLDAKNSQYRAMWLCVYMLLSLFPFLSVMLAFCIGIVNIRVQRRNIALWIGLVIFVYYGIIFQISQVYPLYGGILFVSLFFLASSVIFQRMIIRRY